MIFTCQKCGGLIGGADEVIAGTPCTCNIGSFATATGPSQPVPEPTMEERILAKAVYDDIYGGLIMGEVADGITDAAQQIARHVATQHAALLVENQRLKEELEGHAWKISPAMAQAQIDQLTSRTDELKHDAQMYHWVMERCTEAVDLVEAGVEAYAGSALEQQLTKERDELRREVEALQLRTLGLANQLMDADDALTAERTLREANEKLVGKLREALVEGKVCILKGYEHHYPGRVSAAFRTAELSLNEALKLTTADFLPPAAQAEEKKP